MLYSDSIVALATPSELELLQSSEYPALRQLPLEIVCLNLLREQRFKITPGRIVSILF
jgi:hypothetical protein